MATVDFVWQPNADIDFPHAADRQIASFNEGTNVSTTIPLTFTISAAQATDTTVVIRFGPLFYSEQPFPAPVVYSFTPAGSNGGNVLEQYDVGGLSFVIPAGQTSVTYQLALGADNQVEGDEYFNLYIDSVSGGHTIDSSDVQANQSEFFTLPNPPPFGTFVNNSFGFNTFRIVDDDAPNGSNILTAGNDTYTIAEGSTLPIFAGAGDDTIQGSSGNDVIMGHDGADTIFGNGGDDSIHGGDWLDTIHGGAGNDVIFGGFSEDTLFGDDGDDIIWGDGTVDGLAGVDTIDGGNGNDTLLGQSNNDTIRGGAGVDAIAGGAADDTLIGGDDNDVIFGGAGADIIAGEAGDDVLLGEDNDGAVAGNDGIDGGAGNDTILGQGGNDVLFGEAGNDALAGGDGADYLLGGAGADILGGGNGADLFAFSAGDAGDTIIDFNAGGVRDTIDLRSYFDATGYTGTDPRGAGLLAVYQNGADADVYLQGALMARIQNVTAAALDDTYFLFQ
jgi:Ca2+-binding RTX toxin-like protein